MFCAHCGTILPDGSEFCIHCKQPMDPLLPSPPLVKPLTKKEFVATTTDKAVQKNVQHSRIACIIVSVTLAILLVVTVIGFLEIRALAASFVDGYQQSQSELAENPSAGSGITQIFLATFSGLGLVALFAFEVVLLVIAFCLVTALVLSIVGHRCKSTAVSIVALAIVVVIGWWVMLVLWSVAFRSMQIASFAQAIIPTAALAALIWQIVCCAKIHFAYRKAKKEQE